MGIVFLDLHNAFYNFLREGLFGEQVKNEAFCAVLHE